MVTNTYYQVAIYQGGGLSISGGKNLNGLFSEINVFIGESSIGETITEGHIYILSNNTTQKGQFYREDQNCFYSTTPTHTGTIEITRFDTVNYIISGKFEFQAIADGCGNEEIINITDGRFDMQYIP